MLVVLIAALVAGAVADFLITKATKVSWLGTLIGIGLCITVILVGLGVIA